MNDYLTLSLGIVCAGMGGELFVRGVVGLAHAVRISPGIIGATIAAFATSSPELSVSVTAAIAGSPEIAVGNALGSNVANVALVLAIALVISAIQSSRNAIRRDFPVALLVPAITGLLLLDGGLSRLDGWLLLGVFFVWLGATVAEARRQRSAVDAVLGERRVLLAAMSSCAGLAFLLAAGTFIVSGARGVALAAGMDEFAVGATVVALGTSAPELATAVIAKLRGHDEVGLGTILGSNIFNGVFIVAVAAIIHPIAVSWREAYISLATGLVAVAFAYPTRSGFIERRRGVLLLALYGVYLAAILQLQAA